MYFENGFAFRTRLRNAGPHGQPYGPVPVNCGGNDLFSFLQINFTATIPDVDPSDVVIIALKLILKWAMARKRLRNTVLDGANTPINVHWFVEKQDKLLKK